MKNIISNNNHTKYLPLSIRPHLMKYSRFNSMSDSYFIILFVKLN